MEVDKISGSSVGSQNSSKKPQDASLTAKKQIKVV